MFDEHALKRYSERLLEADFYAEDTPVVAYNLLGKLLIRVYEGEVLVGRIVEVEAYRDDDPASHSYRGKTERNSAMFGPVGHAYVYFTYGMHYCLNIVARSDVYRAGGVLIRALEPVTGIDRMCALRQVRVLKNLTNGPGKVAQAFAISRNLNHHNVTIAGPLMIQDGPTVPSCLIGTSGRIGIRHAREVAWRFFIKDSPWVLRYRG